MDELSRDKEREYRSRTYNIAGFALMTPVGHFIINPIQIINIHYYFYSLIFLLSAYALL